MPRRKLSSLRPTKQKCMDAKTGMTARAGIRKAVEVKRTLLFALILLLTAKK